MRYEHFNIRLHDDHRENLADKKSWVVQCGNGVLDAFTVGQVVDPAPERKTNKVDVQSQSGVLDLSENNGFAYANKTVEITLSGIAAFDGMDDVRSALSVYNGRMIDFTFEDYLAVKWFRTGRCSISYDMHKNRVTFTVDCSPVRYKAEWQTKKIGNSERYDRTGCGWGAVEIFPEIDGEIKQFASGDHWFSVAGSKVGTRFRLRYPAENLPSDKFKAYTMGWNQIVGGTARFCRIDEVAGGWIYYENLTRLQSDSPGAYTADDSLWMECIIDGSDYEWVVPDGETVAQFLPVIRCNYVMADLGYYVHDNEPETTLASEDYFETVPSNLVYRPQVSSAGDSAVIVLDGGAYGVPFTGVQFADVPGLTLPGLLDSHPYARIGTPNGIVPLASVDFRSVMVAVPRNEGETPNVTLRWQPVEVW